MATDGSMASQMEDWLVAKIQAIQFAGFALFDPADVAPWEGTEQDSAEETSRMFMEFNRDLIARVFFLSDTVQTLANGQQDVTPTYVVLVGIRNYQPLRSRRGSATVAGTNRIRDLLRYALHDKQPLDSGGMPISDGVTVFDLTKFEGSAVVINNKIMCLQRTLVTVSEVPA